MPDNNNGLADLYSVRKLGKVLSIPPEVLQALAIDVESKYKRFSIPKKNGSFRTIEEPYEKLKFVQRRINQILLANVAMPSFIMGGVRGRGMLGNVKPHVRKPLVIGIDLRDYFLTVSALQVSKVFSQHFRTGLRTTWLLTRLTTIDKRLPQGAPTSVALANLVLSNALSGIDLQGCSMSVWVDDVTVSGPNASNVIGEIEHRLKNFGLSINPKKTETMFSSTKQFTTGVVLNRKPSLGRERKHAIRNEIRAVAHSGKPRSPRIEGLLTQTKTINPAQSRRLRITADREFQKQMRTTQIDSALKT
jgi:RNA-directed DNA polymerase